MTTPQLLSHCPAFAHSLLLFALSFRPSLIIDVRFLFLDSCIDPHRIFFLIAGRHAFSLI